MKNTIEAGDTVYHSPTRETWLVAATKKSELIPAGWPLTLAKMDDCSLIEKVQPHERAEMLARCLELPPDDLRNAWTQEILGSELKELNEAK